MVEPLELLIAAIEAKRPLVLVLGQDAWRENGREDPVLERAFAHLHRDDTGQPGWRGLLRSALPPTFYEWLAERFERRVAPDWLCALGEIPWSAVFTSSIDPTLRQLFGKRQHPELVLTNAEMPLAIRSRTRPPIYHLFGHAGELEDPRARPPLDRKGLNTRRVNDALPLLGRLLDTATPIGLILVDGIVAKRDWLRIDDILGAVGNAAEQQVIWFKGRSMPLPDDDDFADAVDASRILVADERLSTAISRLRTVGRLADLLTPESEEAGRITFENGRSLEVSPEDRLRVEAAASIVDDAWTAPLIALGKQSAEYAAFRRFHGDPGSGRSLVEGVRRGFAIERDYEEDLGKRVFAAIKNHARVQTPVILHGQSATGKSIALARIVAKVRERKAAAVLYAKSRIPHPTEIMDFCHKAEGAGARATLIVCDTNQDVRLYADLLSGLRSRGHRIVVLGSRYRFIDNRGEHLKTSLEAPAGLSDKERNDLSNLLRERSNEQVVPECLDVPDILSFLYRALPPTRYRIGSGLSAEASRTEQMVRDQAEDLSPRPPRTLMAQRLIEAGLGRTYESHFDERQRRAIESADAASQIIDLVMAAGSLSCPVPFNLLLRLTTDTHSMPLTEVFDMFGGLDLFRWVKDDENNELLVSPRLALEAELICKRRLAGPENEANCIIALIGAIRGVGVERDHEKRFLFKMLRQVGPNGPRGNHYRASYVSVAKTLTNLRSHYGVIDPSVVLQESAFRRHAVREGAVQQDATIMTLLVEARDAVQATIDDIAKGSLHASRRTQRFLKVELASLYGFIAYRHAKARRPNEEVWSTYLAARSSVQQAASATDSYFPMDVGLWTPSDLLSKYEMKAWQRAELTADIYDILDQIDLDSLVPEQRERFDRRRLKTGLAIGDQELSQTAFADLVERRSPAGCYLRARQLAPNWSDHVDTFSDKERQQAKSAADFLDDHMRLIEGDPRSLSLLLECRWICVVGRRPFVNQRQPLPAARHAKQLLLNVVTKLNEACGDNPRNMARYLAAVLTWVVGGEKSATEMFRELARDTEYEDPRRVIQHHLITDEHGHPQKFDGRVAEDPHSGTCKIRLDGGIRQIVRLRTRDFPQYDVAYGRQVRGFGVAFNFIGPIATPITRR